MKIEIELSELNDLTAAVVLLSEQVYNINKTIQGLNVTNTPAKRERETKPAKVTKTTARAVTFSSRDIAAFLTAIVTPDKDAAPAEVEVKKTPAKWNGVLNATARRARRACPFSVNIGQTGYTCTKNDCNNKCFGCDKMFGYTNIKPVKYHSRHKQAGAK